jgi:hypothetical protein
MKEMKPRYAVPIGPYLDKSALLKMGYLDASSSLAMTSMTIAELWSREKARFRRGCPFRQKDLDPYFTVEEIEEARRAWRSASKVGPARKCGRNMTRLAPLGTPSMTRREASEFPAAASTIDRKGE